MPDLSNRLPVTGRLAALPLVLTLVAACSGASRRPPPAPPAPPPGASPTPAITAGPTVGAIDHKTGATDVILRLEEGGGFVPIDFLASQAPSFTLYGDGVIVFQPKVETFPQPDASGVVHGIPWRTAKLDEGQIQELLEFALGPGALGTARDSYFDPRIADAPNTIFTIDAGGVDKSVVISALSDQAEGADAAARAGFWKLASRLRDFDSGGTIPTDAYQAGRYRGVLFDREPQAGPAAADVAVGRHPRDRVQGGAAARRRDEPAAPHAHAGAGRGARDQGRRRRAPGRRPQRAERQVLHAHRARRCSRTSRPRDRAIRPRPTRSRYPAAMCRSIKVLRRPDEPATTGEIEAAARQFVRKVSGYRTPSARNSAAFDSAIAEVAVISRRLLEDLGATVEEGPDRWKPGPGRTPRGERHSHEHPHPHPDAAPA